MLTIGIAVLVVLSALSLGLAARGQRAAARIRRELEHMANEDILTGLRNRVALQAEINQLIGNRSPNGRAAVMLLELDRFAAVNDTYGHDVGDQLMAAAASQITKILRPNESVFRLGGPQFVFIDPSAITRDAAVARATQLQSAIRVQYRINHDHLRISATVGIVMLDQRHTSFDIVMDDAEAAVRDAARRRLGSSSVFELSMRGRINPYVAEARLVEALDRSEFLLMYMPVVTLGQSRIVGVEALLRWADPQRGVVAPDEFLHLLEDSELLNPVTDWIIGEACRQNRAWHEMYPGSDIATTINVSPKQLSEPDFIDRVLWLIEDNGADIGRLCLEVTEGNVRNNIETIWHNLRRAKEAGLQLGLDDFGTGYSTFDYIRKFNFDILKIDRVFVERVTASKEDYAIVQQLVGMAHALDLVAIAEGVDNAEQAAALDGLGCDLAQGYYWSQPQSFDSIAKLLSRGSIRPSANRAKKIDWKAPTAPTG